MNRFRTARYANDQSKQPSLDDNSRALKVARLPWVKEPDEFSNPTSAGRGDIDDQTAAACDQERRCEHARH
jgi:hypothetical protein